MRSKPTPAWLLVVGGLFAVGVGVFNPDLLLERRRDRPGSTPLPREVVRVLYVVAGLGGIASGVIAGSRKQGDR